MTGNRELMASLFSRLLLRSDGKRSYIVPSKGTGSVRESVLKQLPLVSIIVPTYNDEDTIETSLTTLINQTYSNKEVIVVNDGSTDGTFDILSSVASQYPYVRVVSTEHKGISAARNEGLKHAKGEIVFYGEGDAQYSEDYLEKAVRCLAGNPRMGGVCVVGAPWMVRSTFATECINLENEIQRSLLERGKLTPFYAWVLRKDVVLEAGRFDERLMQGEDRDLFLRVKRLGYTIGLVPGIHWRHKRDEDLWMFAKKSYSRGKTRILFLLKHRMITDLLRGVGFLWFLALTISISLFYLPAIYVTLLGVVGAVVYRLAKVVRLGWKVVEKRKYLFLLPFFSLVRHLSFGLGYTWGLAVVFYRKLMGRPLDWSSM